MSRYRVRYLPGGIQRDVGLAVKMRRESERASECEPEDCDPGTAAAYWYNQETDEFDLASVEIVTAEELDYLVARVVSANACPCDVTWSIVVDFPAYPLTHTWDEELREWTPAPTFVLPTPIFIGDAMMFVGDTSTFVYEDNFTLTCTPTICGTVGESSTLHSSGH